MGVIRIPAVELRQWRAADGLAEPPRRGDAPNADERERDHGRHGIGIGQERGRGEDPVEPDAVMDRQIRAQWPEQGTWPSRTQRNIASSSV